jgi:FkbM family methyltransferase
MKRMRNYCVYGFGSLGKKIVDVILNNNDSVAMIFDQKSDLKDYRGIEVTSLNKFDNISEYKDIVFVIAIWNQNINLVEIKENLLSFGIKNILFAGELTNLYQFEHFLFISRKELNDSKHKIDKVLSMFEDKKSKSLFKNLIELRKNNDFINLPQIDSNQYFPKDILEINKIKWNEQVYLDFGAYTGDTLIELAKHSKSDVKYYYGVEPDYDNADSLQITLDELNIDGEILRVASGKTDGLVNFEQGGGVSSKIVLGNETNSKSVPLVCFDNFPFQNMPSIIKMDIEGAEKDTLHGLEKIIIQNRPILMVCLYHTKDDLWEIPIYLKSLVSDYKFYLRQHDNNGLETVLYCF